MIAEALQYLAGLARESREPMLVAESAVEKTYLVNGDVVNVSRPVESREHSADDLASLVALANRFASDEESPVVWLHEDGVALVVNDDGYRDDRAYLEFRKSDLFLAVEKLAREKPWWEQKSFVRLLRVELAGTLEPAVLLEKVRKLRFENGQSVTGEVMRGRESLGREITSRVEAPDIPESVTLALPVYKLGRRVPVECAVEIDPLAGRLQLVPFPDQIERAVDAALSIIHDDLADALDEGVKLYRGRP